MLPTYQMPEKQLTQLPIAAIFIGANFALAALNFIKQFIDKLGEKDKVDDLIFHILTPAMVSAPILTILASNWAFNQKWIAFLSVIILFIAYLALFILSLFSVSRVGPLRKIFGWLSFHVPPEAM